MKELFVLDNGELGVYIHVPFCAQKCSYCDFYSKVSSPWERREYVFTLLEEIRLQQEFLKQRPIRSVFFGGGTPSLLHPGLLGEVLEALHRYGTFTLSPEITIEANPESATMEFLKGIRSEGFNRLSLGAQSFSDRALREIGRIHNSDEIYRAVDDAVSAGFKNLNLDLMMGLPSQTMEELLDDVKKAVALPLTHISYYSLILEKGTGLYDRVAEGEVDLPEEEADRAFYRRAVELLEEQGFFQYEISNFAKEGYQCIHNLNYWKCGDYLGFGPGGASNYGACRFKNVSSYELWRKKVAEGSLAISDEEVLTKRDRRNEWLMLALRLNEGVDIKEFERIFSMDFKKEYSKALQKNMGAGTLMEKEGRIYLTPYGRDVSNTVELDFFI